jgi:hypothetical protein
MGKNINIEKVLLPTCGKLIIDGENVTASILDAELDEIKMTFDYSNTVEIHTQNLSYITLTPKNLMDMIRLIRESENYFKSL